MTEPNEEIIEPQGEEPKEPQDKTYTQSELDSMLDKHTAKALETAKQKWEEEKQDAVNQAEKLAKLSAAERKAEEDKAKQAAFDKREQSLNEREMRYEAQRQLEENNLPTDFVDMVMSSDADTTKANIDKLQQAFNAAVGAGVEEKMKGTTPKAGAGTNAKSSLAQGLGL